MRSLIRNSVYPFTFSEYDKFFNDALDEMCKRPKPKLYHKEEYLENEEKCRYKIHMTGIDKDTLVLSVKPTENKFTITGKIVTEDLNGKVSVVDDIDLSYSVNKKWDLKNKPLRCEYKDGILYVEFGLDKEKTPSPIDIKFSWF